MAIQPPFLFLSYDKGDKTSMYQQGRQGRENREDAPLFGASIIPENQDENMAVILEGAEQWQKFSNLDNEMIISKQGR